MDKPRRRREARSVCAMYIEGSCAASLDCRDLHVEDVARYSIRKQQQTQKGYDKAQLTECFMWRVGCPKGDKCVFVHQKDVREVSQETPWRSEVQGNTPSKASSTQTTTSSTQDVFEPFAPRITTSKLKSKNTTPNPYADRYAEYQSRDVTPSPSKRARIPGSPTRPSKDSMPDTWGDGLNAYHERRMYHSGNESPTWNTEEIFEKSDRPVGLPNTGPSDWAANALLYGAEKNETYSYFESFKTAEREKYWELLRNGKDGWNVVFWVVQSFNLDILRGLLKAGDVSPKTLSPHGIPLLAYALVLGTNNSSEIIQLLIAYGAERSAIPRSFYLPVLQPDGVPSLRNVVPPWYETNHQPWDELFLQKLNLETRWVLANAAPLSRSFRGQKVLDLLHSQDLLRAGAYLVGQSMAHRRFEDAVTDHRLGSKSNTSLVIALAGPSGHGKTLYCEKLSEFMGLDHLFVDMQEAYDDYSILSSDTPLNKFLCAHNGQRAMIVLDDFDKVGHYIAHDALLRMWESGKYTCRQDGEVIDISQSIWLLTTTVADSRILRYCTESEKAQFESGRISEVVEQRLVKIIREKLREVFNAPVASRIDEIVPFVPFSIEERAVLVSRYLAEFKRHIQRPVNVASQHLLGDITLDYGDQEVDVCYAIAAEFYDARDGARGLQRGTILSVEQPLVHRWKEKNGDVHEGGPIERYMLSYDKSAGVRVR